MFVLLITSETLLLVRAENKWSECTSSFRSTAGTGSSSSSSRPLGLLLSAHDKLT